MKARNLKLIQLMKGPDVDLFDFVHDLYDPVDTIKRKEAQYVHPLDHFLVKGHSRPSVEEKCIETKSPSLWSIPDMISDISMSNAKNDVVVSTPPKSPNVFRNRLDHHHPRFKTLYLTL